MDFYWSWDLDVRHRFDFFRLCKAGGYLQVYLISIFFRWKTDAEAECGAGQKKIQSDLASQLNWPLCLNELFNMLAQAQVQDKLHVSSQGELVCGPYTLHHLSMKQVYLSVYARKNDKCQFTYDKFGY